MSLDGLLGRGCAARALPVQGRAQPDRPEHELALDGDPDERRRLWRRLVRGAETPGLFRSIRPAWNDFNLRDLAAQLDTRLFLAHVRATSLATVQETNCHPFRWKNWLFVHNGEIFEVEKRRAGDGTGKSDGKLERKAYESELRKLHVELVKLQEWVKHAGLKVCILFEGRDGAGKGGTIKAITERVSPRVFRVVALPAPTEREKSQMYIQRYIPHLPGA